MKRLLASTLILMAAVACRANPEAASTTKADDGRVSQPASSLYQAYGRIPDGMGLLVEVYSVATANLDDDECGYTHPWFPQNGRVPHFEYRNITTLKMDADAKRFLSVDDQGNVEFSLDLTQIPTKLPAKCAPKLGSLRLAPARAHTETFSDGSSIHSVATTSAAEFRSQDPSVKPYADRGNLLKHPPQISLIMDANPGNAQYVVEAGRFPLVFDNPANYRFHEFLSGFLD